MPDFVRAVCLANLAEWPEGQAIFARATRHALREAGGRMEVDPVFTAAARRSSAVHPVALEVLTSAARQKARGYDNLLAAVCKSTEPRRPDAETLCREGPREEKWDEDRSRGRSLRRFGGGVLAYAGVIAGAYATRNSDAGRAIPTVGGVLSGTILGLVPAVLVELLTFSTSPKNDDHSAIWVLGALVGGTAGGYLAWRLSDGPNARTAVTAATFIIPCVIVARLPF